jgi:hypothetical protein
LPTLTCKYSNGLDVVSEPLHQSIGADHVEDRFESRIRHRRFFVDGFDNFAFFGVPFAYRLRGVREWVLALGWLAVD